MKVIPAIDLMNGHVVRLYKGDPKRKTIYSDEPIKIAKQWEKDGADMLHLVDLDATLGIGSNKVIIKEILDSVSIPIQVAGGLRSYDVIKEMAKISDRVVLGTLAFADKDVLKQLLQELGAQKIVISADHKDGKIVIHGWQKNTEINLIDAVHEFSNMGFTEFLITNVSRDGTMNGPDLEYLEKLTKLEKINVIASGGISNANDVLHVKQKNASSVILGRALYENKLTIKEAIEIA